MTQSNVNAVLNSDAKGYWIVLANINNPTRFVQYTSKAGPLIASYGGRVLARGDVAEAVEGDISGKPYLIEFPNYAAARECFHSPGYQDAIALRDGVAKFQIIIAQGILPSATNG